jgi:hypothetical protein
MDAAALEALGFSVQESEAGLEASLELGGAILNPLSRQFVDQVTFAVVGDRLIPVAPPELVGLAPVPCAGLSKASDAEQLLSDAFNEHVFQLQRRSAELQALGIEPKTDPVSLDLTAELAAGPFTVQLVSDKRGNFRIGEVRKGDEALEGHRDHPLEISEFREHEALIGYLRALLGVDEPVVLENAKEAAPAPRAAAPVRFAEILEQFGAGAVVPPRSALEILVELEVEGARYRFAAARVAGRTFRGLLAGPTGKLWAERFELEAFPGVATLVADMLSVPVDAVRFPLAAEEVSES